MYPVYSRKVFAILCDINLDKILLTANGSTARIVITWLSINKGSHPISFVNTANNRFHKNKSDTAVIITD